jgi:hypothetical protein
MFDDRNRSLTAGFSEHVTKPIDPRAFLEPVLYESRGARDNFLENDNLRQSSRSRGWNFWICRNQLLTISQLTKMALKTLSQCFTEDAVLKDEGQTYNGRAAIKEWKARASEKYQYTSEPLTLDQKDRKVIVTSRLTGNFPGSSVNLRFFFELDREKIRSLEIIPKV